MGYSYIYPQVQTADYTVKFVHNDFLQQALDTGIIPMLMLLYLFAYNILSKKTTSVKREILIIMLLHMMLEFDMHFLVIHLILVMLLEETEEKNKFYKIGNAKIATGIVTVAIIGVLAYFGVSDFADKTGNFKLALELLPNKTSANVQKLADTQNLNEAEKIANKILQQNQYIALAYKVKSNYAYCEGNWEQMLENQRKAISLNKYDVQEYEDYVFLISNGLEQTVTQGKEAETEYLIEEALKVEELLEKTKQNTNPLAYKTVDKPELELSEETTRYLQNLENYKNNKEE